MARHGYASPAKEARRLEHGEAHHSGIATLDITHKDATKSLNSVGTRLIGRLTTVPVSERLVPIDFPKSHGGSRQTGFDLPVRGDGHACQDTAEGMDADTVKRLEALGYLGN